MEQVIELIEHYRKFSCMLAMQYIGHNDALWEEYKDLASRGSLLIGKLEAEQK